MLKQNKKKIKIKEKEINPKINILNIKNNQKFLLNFSKNSSIKLETSLDNYLNIPISNKIFKLNKFKNNSSSNSKNLSFNCYNKQNKSSSLCSKISNKKNYLKTINKLNNKNKNNLRNKKIIDYFTHYKTEFDIKSQSESITTATNTKRNKNLTQNNLTITNNKKISKLSFNLIKNKIYNKLNSLKGKTLHLKKKEDENIISEESVFNSKNSSITIQNKSNNSKINNSILYLKESNKNILDTSLTYSDDTDTKRYKISKNKIMDNNIINNKNNYYNNEFYNVNNNNNNNNNHIKELNIKKNDDFKNFYELIQQKLFGIYDK